ncbi:MAG TPA: outer membrane lipoprotein carrier protein LolA [Polyangia bacterium]|jgi:outer membrane lipoprotein carrier protein|nr:outer membrane lipoprotein carrier protein LolA [Polyangia bacterium]
MVKPLVAAIAAWLTLGVTAAAYAEAPALDALLKDVDAAKASVTTLSGEFTQKNRVKLFKQELIAKGKLYFRQPRQIRWEYTTPDPSTLILDGNRATLTSPGAAPQVFDLAKDATMRAIFDQLLVWLGSGSLAQARVDYDIASGGTTAAPTLLLTPKAASAVARAFTRVELRLDGKTHLLRAIALVEPNGDEKEIVFTKLTKNAALPENAFR